MWTNDGILIEKKEGKYKVFSDDEETFRVFSLKNGELNDYFVKQVKFENKEDGLYQAEVGYGPVNSFQDPCIYWLKRIGDKLNWDFPKEK